MDDLGSWIEPPFYARLTYRYKTMNETKLYKAMRLIRHSGSVFTPGTDEEELELTNKQAAQLLALVPPAIVDVVEVTNVELNGVDSTTPQRPEDDSLAKTEIVAAINALDENNTELWTKAGQPATSAIEAILGYQVSAAERDALWLELTTNDTNNAAGENA